MEDYYNYLKNRSFLRLFIRKFFVRDLIRHFQGRVLDVGCGIGEFLDAYTNSYGVDLNPFVVHDCLRRGHACNQANANRLPFADQTFDGVLASNVLEHLSSPVKAFAEAARVLKPGGKYGVTVPLEAGFRHDPTHVYMLRESDLRALASQCDLNPVTFYRYPFQTPFLGKRLYFCELRAIFEKNVSRNS